MQTRWLLLLAIVGLAAGAALHDPEAKMLPVRVETSGKRSTNDVLRHIGMTRVKSPPHHRKRLASQSRKSHSGDSHMYVIKLPANPYYYEGEQLQKSGAYAHPNSVNKIPLSFKSNGKPGKIYHWNLPVVKKMAARKATKGANQIFKPKLWREEAGGDRRVSYYKPKKPSKQAFHKFFPGNGKPQSLYVIETKNKKNANHHDQNRLRN